MKHRLTDKQKGIIIQMGRGACLYEYISPIEQDCKFLMIDSDGGEAPLFQSTLSILEELGILRMVHGDVDSTGCYCAKYYLNDKGTLLAKKLSQSAKRLTRAARLSGNESQSW